MEKQPREAMWRETGALKLQGETQEYGHQHAPVEPGLPGIPSKALDAAILDPAATPAICTASLAPK